MVPWGRSLDEYARMFDLTPRDLRARILDCGGGPASFNAEATAAGHRIVSCDPLYRHSADGIRRRVEESSVALLENARAHRDRFVWREIRSPEHLVEVRMAAMGRFLADFPRGPSRAGTGPTRCPNSRSRTTASIWRSAPTSCFSTRIISLPTSMSPP